LSYVLDTNAVSALMRGEPGVVERLKRVKRTEVKLPGPVLAEIYYGIGRLPRSKRQESLRLRFDLIRKELGRAEWTDEVSARFGAIKAALEKRGERIEDFDAAIAAHALATDSVLVTANLRQMNRIPGLTIEDWATGA
jgi:tRNA(fMet)-specific endonuclease VapC